MLRLLRPAVRLGCSPLTLAPSLSVDTPVLVHISQVHTPVHVAEQFLVGFQELSGASWWFSIAAATLTIRSTITLPLAAYQSVVLHRVASLQREISELSLRLRYEVSVRAKEVGWSERACRFQFKKNMRRIVSELYVRDNCHPFKASILVLVQVPVWISLSLALRDLSLDSSAVYSALAAGGALWFKDLTVPDPTWIIPVSLGLTNLLLVEVASLQQKPVVGRFQKVLLHCFRAVSLLMIPVSAYVPTVHYSWCRSRWFGDTAGAERGGFGHKHEEQRRGGSGVYVPVLALLQPGGTGTQHDSSFDQSPDFAPGPGQVQHSLQRPVCSLHHQVPAMTGTGPGLNQVSSSAKA